MVNYSQLHRLAALKADKMQKNLRDLKAKEAALQARITDLRQTPEAPITPSEALAVEVFGRWRMQEIKAKQMELARLRVARDPIQKQAARAIAREAVLSALKAEHG